MVSLAKAKARTKPRTKEHAKPKAKMGDWDAQTDQIIESFQSDIYRAALLKEQEERQAVEAQLSEAAQARRNAEMIAARREQ